MVETRGVSWSLACNGNSAICCGFSTLQISSRLSSLPLEPSTRLTPCGFSNSTTMVIKKRLSKVVIFYYWSEQSSEQEALITIVLGDFYFVQIKISLLNSKSGKNNCFLLKFTIKNIAT